MIQVRKAARQCALVGTARQACRRGHFFVLIANRDHIFFEYAPRMTSACFEEVFRGYSG
jgi:transposase